MVKKIKNKKCLVLKKIKIIIETFRKIY